MWWSARYFGWRVIGIWSHHSDVSADLAQFTTRWARRAAGAKRGEEGRATHTLSLSHSCSSIERTVFTPGIETKGHGILFSLPPNYGNTENESELRTIVLRVPAYCEIRYSNGSSYFLKKLAIYLYINLIHSPANSIMRLSLVLRANFWAARSVTREGARMFAFLNVTVAVSNPICDSFWRVTRLNRCE